MAVAIFEAVTVDVAVVFRAMEVTPFPSFFSITALRIAEPATTITSTVATCQFAFVDVRVSIVPSTVFVAYSRTNVPVTFGQALTASK